MTEVFTFQQDNKVIMHEEASYVIFYINKDALGALDEKENTFDDPNDGLKHIYYYSEDYETTHKEYYSAHGEFRYRVTYPTQ